MMETIITSPSDKELITSRKYEDEKAGILIISRAKIKNILYSFCSFVIKDLDICIDITASDVLGWFARFEIAMKPDGCDEYVSFFNSHVGEILWNVFEIARSISGGDGDVSKCTFVVKRENDASVMMSDPFRKMIRIRNALLLEKESFENDIMAILKNMIDEGNDYRRKYEFESVAEMWRSDLSDEMKEFMSSLGLTPENYPEKEASDGNKTVTWH